MNEFPKVGLYDTLAMIIPGFLLLLPFCCCALEVPSCDIGKWGMGVMIFVASYVVGLIYHHCVDKLFRSFKFRNNEKCIKRQYEDFCNDLKKCNKGREVEVTHYYKAYYLLMKKNCLNNIPILEAQVTFIRNLLPIMLVYTIAICCCGCNIFGLNSCILAISLLVTGVILAFTLCAIQNKIYYLVWEGEKYLKKDNKTK